MDLGLKNKTALITGASRGIGQAIAISLAKEGVNVTIVARNNKNLNKTLDMMGGNANKHTIVELDLLEEGSEMELFNILKERKKNDIDILVHNLGGSMDITDPLCSLAKWRKIMRFNLEISVELNRLIIPYMKKKNWGRIVHISSISAMENHGPPTYCAAKAALSAYTRSVGGYVARDGIVMSSVLPGAIFTKGGYWDEASNERIEHVQKYLKERQRIGRFGDVKEIADFVTFLASDLASFNTGSIIPIDGGQGRGYFGQ